MHWGNLQFASVVMSLFIVPLFLHSFLLGASSYFWNSVEGSVIKSESTSISMGSGWKTVSLIKFSYIVGDEIYESPRVKVGKKYYDEKFEYLYKVNQPVLVYYPSFYPSYGILIKGITINCFYKFILMCIFIYTFKLSSTKLKEKT